jgi:hypothetical protein
MSPALWELKPHEEDKDHEEDQDHEGNEIKREIVQSIRKETR